MIEVEIPSYTVIQYVRNKDNTPQGVIVALKKGNGFNIGYSLCNKKDKFDKSLALKIAIGRAQSDFESEKVRMVPQKIKNIVPSFLARCRKYYKLNMMG